MEQTHIAEVFLLLHDHYDRRGDIHRARTFNACARALIFGDTPVRVGGRIKVGGLTFGPGGTQAYDEIAETGWCSRLPPRQIFEEQGLVRKSKSQDPQNPPAGTDITKLGGVGPVRVSQFHAAGFKSIEDLVANPPKLGQLIGSLHWSEQMQTSLELFKLTGFRRHPRYKIEKMLPRFLEHANFMAMGSFRREEKDSKDLDLVLFDDNRTSLEFVGLLDRIFVKGPTKISGIFEDLPVDIRVVPVRTRGCHILHSTGSGSFNIVCRAYSKKKLGKKLSEYDLGGEYFDTEEDVFRALGLEFVAPQFRSKGFASFMLKEHSISQSELTD